MYVSKRAFITAALGGSEPFYIYDNANRRVGACGPIKIWVRMYASYR